MFYGYDVQVDAYCIMYLHKINRQYMRTNANLCYTDNLICLINKTILYSRTAHHTRGAASSLWAS